MTTRSLQKTKPLSKRLESIEIHFLSSGALLRDVLHTNPSGKYYEPESQSSNSMKYMEVPRHLRQTDSLERCCFF
jgi:hypothetical protein